MSERYKPKDLIRERARRGPTKEALPSFTPEPREQVVYRNGKATILQPLLCRLHNMPWQTCTVCSAPKR